MRRFVSVWLVLCVGCQGGGNTEDLKPAVLLPGGKPSVSAAPAKSAIASNRSLLFVPADRVPLSAFKRLSAPATLVLAVKPEIVQWVLSRGGNIEIAQNNAPQAVRMLQPSTIDQVTGTIVLNGAAAGDYVVVADLIVNDFPIVTHWDKSKNQNRGGQSRGATDSLGLYTYKATTGDIEKSGLSLLNKDPAFFDAQLGPVAGLYDMDTANLALYSDGTELTPERDGEPADALVPAVERYIGENFATNGVTAEAAIRLSDRTREQTGYPVVHRNDGALQGQASGLGVTDGLPLFQVVHAVIVPFEDPSIPGAEQSLATFLLPPGWTRQTTKPYPLLFNGLYDIHAAMFGNQGERFLEILGNVVAVDSTYLAVGVLWNGGGATAQTMHPSAHGNVALLLQMASDLAAADPYAVITAGGSRGGTTALEVAANPLGAPYKVLYAVAGNPQTQYGDALETMANPTHRLLQNALVGATGYRNAWQEGWLDPNTKTAAQRAALTLIGDEQFDVIDNTVANVAPTMIAGLVNNNVRVILRSGTHDFSNSIKHIAEYDQALRKAGVPLLHDLSYRYGHSHVTDVSPKVEDLLVDHFSGQDSFQPGLRLWAPADATFTQSTPVNAGHIPLVLEMPIVVGENQRHVYTVAGEPGALYEVRVAQADALAWKQSGSVTLLGPLTTLVSGTLPTTGPIAAATHTLSLPKGASGLWAYELRYSVDGGATYYSVSQGATAFPTLPNASLILVLPTPQLGIDDISRTGGVSADVLF